MSSSTSGRDDDAPDLVCKIDCVHGMVDALSSVRWKRHQDAVMELSEHGIVLSIEKSGCLQAKDFLKREVSRVIVSHRLPLRASPDPAAPFGFSFVVDAGTVAYQLRSGLPANAPVLHIGTLPEAAAEAASDELSNYLVANFSCLPVYLPTDLHRRFYHGFYKHYLWPLLHYLLPLTPSSLGGLPFQRTLYHSFLSANRAFTDRLTEVLSPDEDLVWIHDYHLLALPRCNSFECAHKKLTILEAPNILRIALKRYQSGVFGKISKDVKFPDHLNLSEYICRTDDFNPVYSLCGRGCRWGHTAPLYYGTLSSCSCEHGEDRCLWRFCIFVLALLFQKATKKVTFNRSLIREVAGFAPYEKGTTELLKVWKDKPALNVAKRKLGTQKSELF